MFRFTVGEKMVERKTSFFSDVPSGNWTDIFVCLYRVQLMSCDFTKTNIVQCINLFSSILRIKICIRKKQH